MPDMATWPSKHGSRRHYVRVAILIILCCADRLQFLVSGRDYLWLCVLICVLQSVVTLAIHCAELHINLTRNEAVCYEISLGAPYDDGIWIITRLYFEQDLELVKWLQGRD